MLDSHTERTTVLNQHIRIENRILNAPFNLLQSLAVLKPERFRKQDGNRSLSKTVSNYLELEKCQDLARQELHNAL